MLELASVELSGTLVSRISTMRMDDQSFAGEAKPKRRNF
jgi:hypothetical protein